MEQKSNNIYNEGVMEYHLGMVLEKVSNKNKKTPRWCGAFGFVFLSPFVKKRVMGILLHQLFQVVIHRDGVSIFADVVDQHLETILLIERNCGTVGIDGEETAC